MDRDLYLTVIALARQTPWLHDFMAAYALWGGLVLLSLLLVVGWLQGRRRKDAPARSASALLTGLSVVTAVLLNQHLISPLIGRVRPCNAVAGAQALLPCGQDFSMPSDHCIMAGAFMAGLFFVSRKLGILAVIAAAVLAFGRVYTGMHYPTDTVAGLAAGTLIALVLQWLLHRPVSLLLVRLNRTPLAVLVQAPRASTAPHLPAIPGK
ncbi:phosphatase PAP2 family protein [Arthrobacter sp. 1P04PC]|uniref:phosphatase PAP2 family protein n=1 Tax=unclassified Arthrobacter TaxID=235627 RepID=UPI0039A3F28E